MVTYLYWLWVYNDTGGMFKVTVRATSAYEAYQMVAGQYGEVKVINKSGNVIPGSEQRN
jgi:hypothetical protein